MKPRILPTPRGQKGRVYSYLRYSTPEQKLGDSERRQIESAKDYADKFGLTFDEEMRDEGMSAWSGTHRKKGSLRRFLDKVEAGGVPSGSVLFVEELDRLSREGMTEALETIVVGLIKHGIAIATPGGTYDRQSLNSGGIWRLIAKLETAHEESEKKSARLGHVWAEKKKRARREGVMVTSRVPVWLKVVDGKCAPIKEAVRTVQLIFKLSPLLGRSRLVKKLNKEATWSPPGRRRGSTGNGWRMSYVRKILSNRAVLGEYQPFTKRGGGKRIPDGEPILNYFPQIIAPGLFHTVQLKISENRERHHGGRTGAAFNIFQNLAKCAYCGGPMVYRDHGQGTKSGKKKLICDNAQRGFKCKPRSARYSEVQEAVLGNCEKLRPEQVLPDDTDRLKKCESLRTRILGAEGQLKSNEEQLTNLVAHVSGTPSASIRTRYEKKMEELEEQNRQIDLQLEIEKAELRREEKSRQSFRNWQHDLTALKEAILPRSAIDARLRLQSHLKEFIEKVEIFADGFPKQYDSEIENSREGFRTTDTFAEIVEDLVAEYGIKTITRKKLNEFLAFTMERRMSKEGRFFRIHFKGGVYKDLVPSGSLASGEALLSATHNKWKFTSPRLDELWKTFIAHGAKDARR